jgi:hypothetical protein
MSVTFKFYLIMYLQRRYTIVYYKYDKEMENKFLFCYISVKEHSLGCHYMDFINKE